MKKYEEILFIKSLKGFGNAKVNKNKAIISKFEGLNDAVEWAGKQGVPVTDIKDAEKAVHAAKEKLDENISAITILDEEYPLRLHDLNDSKPTILYTIGDISVLNKTTIGIIGTRNPSKDAEESFISLMKGLNNIVVVSGLAKGCDTIGHRFALNHGLKTVAVLPSGFNAITPKGNKALAEEIVADGGLLISEYLPDVNATTFTPKQRDVIIAALSDNLISLQCGLKSGTLYTIEKGYKLGRNIGFNNCRESMGDFTGHYFIKNNYKGKELNDSTEIREFIIEMRPRKKPNEDSLEQMSIFFTHQNKV